MKTYFIEVLIDCGEFGSIISLYVEAKNLREAVDVLRKRYGEVHQIVKIISITEDSKKINKTRFEAL